MGHDFHMYETVFADVFNSINTHTGACFHYKGLQLSPVLELTCSFYCDSHTYTDKAHLSLYQRWKSTRNLSDLSFMCNNKEIWTSSQVRNYKLWPWAKFLNLLDFVFITGGLTLVEVFVKTHRHWCCAIYLLNSNSQQQCKYKYVNHLKTRRIRSENINVIFISLSEQIWSCHVPCKQSYIGIVMYFNNKRTKRM